MIHEGHILHQQKIWPTKIIFYINMHRIWFMRVILHQPKIWLSKVIFYNILKYDPLESFSTSTCKEYDSWESFFSSTKNITHKSHFHNKKIWLFQVIFHINPKYDYTYFYAMSTKNMTLPSHIPHQPKIWLHIFLCHINKKIWLLQVI